MLALGQRIDPPRDSDGVAFRVLQNLLMLKGERLIYRALDVEQIGSVYQAKMGFTLATAKGPAIAVLPQHMVVELHPINGTGGRPRSGTRRWRGCSNSTGSGPKRSNWPAWPQAAARKARAKPGCPPPLIRKAPLGRAAF